MRAIVAAGFVLTLSLPAFARDAPKQTHHCKMSDGTMDTAKTKKECKAAKGKWVKDTAAAADGSKPAEAPAK